MTATIKPAELRVTLYQGDDMAAIQDAFAAVEEAEGRALQLQRAASGASPRAGDAAEGPVDSSEVLKAAAKYDALVKKAKPRSVSVLMRATGRKKWREFQHACPPRPDDEQDARVGFDQEKMSDLLVPECLAEPEFGSIADKEAFLDSLSDAQFQMLFNAAYTVNRGSLPDPKADMSSTLSQIYAVTSSSDTDSDAR